MSGENRYPRPADVPNAMSSGSRPPQHGAPPGTGPGLGSQPGGRDPSQMSRAERFDDEKRRIIESCFVKMDDQGHLLESYITHIRIVEDSQYPQTPAPPESDPKNRKDRILMVSVRAAGRVRIHKGRENPNHSFSIGKTWNMDDLTGITSYSNFEPQNEEQARWKSWAGDTGFILEVGKPYYWRANSAKEKEFFIASVVKIFTKYTKGRVPRLTGFSQQEERQLMGFSTGARPKDQFAGRPMPPPGPAARTPGYREDAFSSPEPLFTKSQTPDSSSSRTQSRPPTSQGENPSLRQQMSPSIQSDAPSTGTTYSSQSQLRRPGSRGREMEKPPSREQIRQGYGQDRLTPQSSRSDLTPQGSGTPESISNRNRGGRPSGAGAEASQYQRPADAARKNEQGPFNSTKVSPELSRPGGVEQRSIDQSPRRRPDAGATAQQNGSPDVANDIGKTPLPERRRPPIPEPQLNGSQQNLGTGRTLAGAAMGPGNPDSLNSASASNDNLLKNSRTIPGAFYPSPAPSDQIESDGLIPPPLSPRLRRDGQQTLQPDSEAARGSEPQIAPEVQTPEVSKDEQSKEPGNEGDLEEEARPGLGRMFGKNKKTTQDLFRKAATAYNAFVPRAGGAGAKMRQQGEKETEDADGISSVFTPSVKRTDTADSTQPAVATPAAPGERSTVEQPPRTAAQPTVPEVTVSSPLSPKDSIDRNIPGENSTSNLGLEVTMGPNAASLQKKVSAEQEAPRKRRRRSAHQTQYLSKLGVDVTLFEGRCLDFEDLLHDINCDTSAFRDKNIDQLELELRRDVARIETGSWLEHLVQKDDRIETVERLLDKAIAEVEEFEGLLTLYSVELGSLNEDVAYIEAQSQGLQVQAANQKLLQSELEQLVETISITPQQLEPLRRASPGSSEGLQAIERTLLGLYKAMVTIDPTIRHQGSPDPRRLSGVALGNSELSYMIALQEKREIYLQEATNFINRLKQFMDMTFGASLLDVRDALDRRRASVGASTKLSVEAHDAGRMSLWQYSPLLLFVKEIDMASWETVLRMYQARARPTYQDEFRENVQLWKRLARRPTGDEEQLLFTYNDKEPEGLGTTARKLTVKRSQTLARSLRAASNEKSAANKNSNAQSGGLWAFEVFSNALDEMTPLIFTEQNFIVDFFHATGTDNLDFVDAVTTEPPESRKGSNLFARKMFETDRKMARLVMDVMEEIFSSFPSELQSLLDWALKTDPLQGIGVLHALHRCLASLEDTNQDFLTRTLTTMVTRLNGLWSKFVDEQIRAIEETKVKIKKRKGVIAFIKVFPNFSAAIENMLPPASEEPAETSEVRAMVDKAYERINMAMLESLRVIAKESPGAGIPGPNISSVNDPEDKEALNYHILLIENMNHYAEEVDERGDPILAKGRQEAREDMEEHLKLYVDAVIRRPLGKILDFTESLGHMRDMQAPDFDPASLANRPSTSKQVFKKLLSGNDSRELRRGVELLRKRVEKHFGEADEPGISRGLVNTVWKACENRYIETVRHVIDLANDIYEGEGLPWTDEKEVERWFRSGR